VEKVDAERKTAGYQAFAANGFEWAYRRTLYA
jgi:hypothetical protein